MTSGIQTLPAYQALMEVLRDQKGLEDLLSYPKQALVQTLTERQQGLWSMLVQHYSPVTIVEDTEDEGVEGKDRKRKRSKASPRNPWAAFSKIESLVLPAPYKDHIEKYGSDPARFLNDKVILTHQIAEPNSDEGDAFMACFRYTLHLQSREAKDRVRWFFSMLLYYDLAQLKKPAGSGRVGHLMEERIRNLVEERVPGEALPLDPLDELGKWSKQGSKLDVFCQAFGLGSLFFLGHLLSENFLNKRFTQTGEYHNQAIAHLRTLGLGEMAQDSKANDLGQSIRSYLIRPFREAHLKQLSDTTISIPPSS